MGIEVSRTLDVGLCLEIISRPEIWNVISEDTATVQNNIPDVVKDYWLKIVYDEVVIGVCHLHQKWLNTAQCHIQILEKHRDFSIESGKCIIKWIVDNTDYHNIYTEVPVIYSNVIDFLKSFDFKESGLIRDCYTKDQKPIDIIILTKKVR